MKHVLKHAGTAALALTLLLSGCGQTVGQASDQETEKRTENTATQAISLVTDFPTTQYFTDEAVQEGDVTTILTAGVNAPSAMNGQPWHFTAITDRDVLQQIADDMSSGFPAGMQPPAEGESGTESPSAPPEGGDGDMELESPAVEDGESTPPAAAGSGDESGAAPAKADITGAPLAIVISCAEGSELDAGLACQTMSVTAQLLGYGTKILSSPTIALNGERQEDYRQLLGIPEDYSAAAVLLVGYADRSTDGADSVTGATERNPLDEQVTYVTAE